MKRSAKSPLQPFDPQESDIQKCAYFLWQEEGRLTNRDLEIWLTAKELVRHHVPDHRPQAVPRRRRSA